MSRVNIVIFKMDSIQFLCLTVLFIVPFCSGNFDTLHQNLQERLEILEQKDMQQSSIIQQLQKQLLNQETLLQKLSTTNNKCQKDCQNNPNFVENIFKSDSRTSQVANTDNLVRKLKKEVESLQATVGTTNQIVSYLQSKVKALQTEVEDKEDTMKEMKALVNQQDEEITTLKSVVYKLKPATKQNKPRVALPKQEHSAKIIAKGTLNVREGNTNRYRAFNESDTPKTHAYGSVDTNKRFVATDGPVAFHAVSDVLEISHLGINQNIVFETSLLNLGGGYHNQHGLFTAPKAGLYIFSASLNSWKDDHPEIVGALVKNGITLARIFCHGDNHRHDQGSVSAVIQLDVGDEVWVKNEYPTDAYMWGYRYVSFTGILVTEM